MFYYICAVVTLISSAVSFGFSIEAYMKSKNQSEISLTNAKYAMSRSFSLLLVAIGLFLFLSAPYLVAVSAAMIGVQLIPDYLKPVALLPLGYPASDVNPHPVHYKRFDVNHTVFYNSFDGISNGERHDPLY